MQADEQTLVQAARRGEPAAGAELVERHYAAIFAFLRRLAGSETEAADLTQITFTRVWQALPGFAGRSTLRSWLHGIAHHVYVDWRRRNGRLEARPDAWWLEQADGRSRPDRLAVEADLAAAVYAAVDGLQPDLRETVHLHYYQELTLEQTAEVMDIASSTVKYRLRQALDQLQSRLSAQPAPAFLATTRTVP
jgi:RNA polymerase sigma-70 factor (ECF subfamily)